MGRVAAHPRRLVEHAGRTVRVVSELVADEIRDPASRKRMVSLRVITPAGSFEVALPPLKAKELACLIQGLADELIVQEVMKQ